LRGAVIAATDLRDIAISIIRERILRCRCAICIRRPLTFHCTTHLGAGDL
jgi:hypothetical protein